MFVCLCTGATTHTVADAVACGARTCNDVAKVCGAGSDCGRCRRTVRAIIAATSPDADRALDERLELAESR
jgi:bacterioferritin-associated ferredoxin